MAKLRVKKSTKKKVSKSRFMLWAANFFKAKADATEAQKKQTEARQLLLDHMKTAGLADRIDPSGHRWYQFEDGDWLKLEHRQRTDVDWGAAASLLKKTKKGRQFVTYRVVGGPELMAFLKKHHFTDFDVEEVVTKDDLASAVQAKAITPEQLREVSKVSSIWAVKLEEDLEEDG